MGEGEDLEGRLGGGAGGVELLDEGFEEAEVRGACPDDDGAGARLGDDGDLGRLLRGDAVGELAELGGGELDGLGLEDLGEGLGDEDGVGVLEGEEAELGLVAIEVEGELGDEALDILDLGDGAGEDEGVGLLVDGNGDAGGGVGVALGTGLDLLDDGEGGLGGLGVDAFEELGHLVGGDAVEGAEADDVGGVLALGVEAGDEFLDLGEVGAAPDEGEGVVGEIGLDDGALGLGAIGEDGLDLGGDVEGAALAEPDELDVAVGAIGGLVEGGEELLDDGEVVGGAGDHEGVGAVLDGDVGLAHEAAAAARGVVGGGGAGEAAPGGDGLEDGLEDDGDLLGVAVLELVDADLDLGGGGVGVEFPDDAEDVLDGVGGAVEEDGVGAGDGGDDDAGGGVVSGAVGEGTIDGVGDVVGSALGDADGLEDGVATGLGGVEGLDDGGDGLELGLGAGEDELVGGGVVEDEGLAVAELGVGAGLVLEDLTDLGGDVGGAAGLEGDDAHGAVGVGTEGLVELLDDDGGGLEFLGVAGGDEGAGF